MKKVKWLISLFFFLLCFLLSSEMFQNYLHSFTNQFYYIDVTTDNRECLYNMLLEISRKMRVPVFSVTDYTKNFDSTHLTFFINNDDFETISKKYNVEVRSYPSLFSGETLVECQDISDVVSQTNIDRFYFDASSQEIEQIYYYLNQSFSTSYAHKENKTGSEWIIKIIWLVPLLFLLLMTWFGIEFEKKKFFLRISLGASKTGIILKNLLIDNLVMSIEFIALYACLKKNIYIEYHFFNVCLFFAIFLIVNSFLYIFLAKFNYKEIIYSANLNQSLLSNCYLMKSLTLILTIASLSTNAYLLYQNVYYFRYYSVINKCNDECFLNFVPDYQYYKKNVVDSEQISNSDDIPEELMTSMVNREIYEKCVNSLIFNYLYEDRIKYVKIELENNDKDKVLFLNDLSMVVTNKLNINTSCDFTFVFPKNYSQEMYYTEVDAVNSIKYNLGLPEGSYSYMCQTYDFKTEVLYMDCQENGNSSGYGFEPVNNPIMIVCNMNGQKIKKIHDYNQISPQNINAFSLGCIRFSESPCNNGLLGEKYHFSYCDLVSVPQYYENNEKLIMRIVLLNAVISIFMLVLEFSFILLIIRLEYIINAKLLSIKKILGYSIIQKNRSIIGLNSFSSSIGCLTNLIYFCMFRYSSWYFVIIVSIIVFAIENIVIVFNIQKIENASVSKILKGGSL